MDGQSYLQRDTWSNFHLCDFELDALVDLLSRTEPATPAELVIRDRFVDAQIRRNNVKEMFT